MGREAHEIKMIPFNQIKVDDSLNSRQHLQDVKKLADSIAENGLKSALLVTNGGEGEKPYTLAAGFRRAAALSLLKWGSKQVPVMVVSDSALDNLIENVERDDLHPLDLAERLADMLAGQYPTPPGVEPRVWERKELAAKVNLSMSSLSNYVRVHEKISAEVKKLLRAQKNRVPLRLLFEWAMLSEEKQAEVAEEWSKAMEGGDGNKRKRTSKAQKEEKEKAELGLIRGAKNFEAVTDAIKVVSHKMKEAKGNELSDLEGKLGALRWVAGKVKSLPGLTQEDFDAVFPPEEDADGEE